MAFKNNGYLVNAVGVIGGVGGIMGIIHSPINLCILLLSDRYFLANCMNLLKMHNTKELLKLKFIKTSAINLEFKKSFNSRTTNRGSTASASQPVCPETMHPTMLKKSRTTKPNLRRYRVNYWQPTKLLSMQPMKMRLTFP